MRRLTVRRRSAIIDVKTNQTTQVNSSLTE